MRELMLGLLFIVVVGVLYYIFVYNRLQYLVNSVDEASSGIDVALLKRFDLISNLVEVVRGYSKHEKELLSELTAIRSNINNARDVANEQMASTLGRLNVIVESHPELKASTQYLNLQKNLTNVEEHLQASRRLYNRSVTELNNVIRQFPTNYIAKNHHIEGRQLFAAPAEALDKPEVNLE